MANFAPNFRVPVGGGHFRAAGPTGSDQSQSGGWIEVTTNIPNGATGEPQTYDIDVARWELDMIFVNKPLVCGGLFGATDARLIGYQNIYRAIIVRDINMPPDFRLRGIAGCKIILNLGDVVEGCSILSTEAAVIEPRFYYSPDVTIDRCTQIADANGKKMNRDLVVGRFRSHVFLCPEQGDPDDVSTLAGAYNKWYTTRIS